MFSLRVLKKAKIDTKVATNAVEVVQALLEKFKLEPFTEHTGRALAERTQKSRVETLRLQ